jgi:hypothetical protein
VRKEIQVLALGHAGLMLSGCTTWEPKMDAAMASWVGESAESVIAAWGPPDWTQSGEGYAVYIWKTSSRVTFQGETVTSTTATNGVFESSNYTMPSQTINASCARMIAVDQANRISQWGWRGDCSRVVQSSVNARSAAVR